MYIPKTSQGENCKLVVISGKYNLIWKLRLPGEQESIGSNLRQGHGQEHLQHWALLFNTMEVLSTPRSLPKSKLTTLSPVLSKLQFLSEKLQEILKNILGHIRAERDKLVFVPHEYDFVQASTG